MLILKVVRPGPIHGYGVAQRGEWRAADTGREAKFYTLTKTRCKQLDIEASDGEGLSEAVRFIMPTAE